MNKYETINTFTQRPSVAQIVSYILFTLQITTFYAIIQQRYSNTVSSIVFHVLFGISILGEIVTTVVTSYVDPSDPFMIEYRNNRLQVLERCSDMNNFLYCDICRSYVQIKSRHCKICGRCVQNFDHHCMWINNCIGSKNYVSFVFMITFTFCSMLLYVSAIAVLWVEALWDKYLAQMIVLWISGFIITVFVVLIFNLILLHIYLKCKGMTTFELIVAQRQEKRLQEIEKQIKEEEQKLKQKRKEKAQNSEVLKTQEANKTEENIVVKTRVIEQIVEEHKKSSNQQNESEKQSKKPLEFIFNDLSEVSQSDRSSIKINNFFTRNKSLKIFVADKVEKPTPKNSQSMKGEKFYKTVSVELKKN